MSPKWHVLWTLKNHGDSSALWWRKHQSPDEAPYNQTTQYCTNRSFLFCFFYQSVNNQVADGTGTGYLKQSSKVDYDTIYISSESTASHVFRCTLCWISVFLSFLKTFLMSMFLPLWLLTKECSSLLAFCDPSHSHCLDNYYAEAQIQTQDGGWSSKHRAVVSTTVTRVWVVTQLAGTL